jgi:prevent-host-death family protein
MKTTIHAAKTNLSKLIAQAEAGEEVVILRDTTPVARLTGIAPTPRGRQFGALRGKVSVGAPFFEPLPADELGRWE